MKKSLSLDIVDVGDPDAQPLAATGQLPLLNADETKLVRAYVVFDRSVNADDDDARQTRAHAATLNANDDDDARQTRSPGCM